MPINAPRFALLRKALLAMMPLAPLAIAAPASAQAAPAAAVRVLPARLLWNGAPAAPAAWPGTIPAGTAEEAKNNGEWIYNVSAPSWQPYLPDPAKATGAAVIVAPGGGFRFLSIHSEGTRVAQWLAERGIAAFVLKYRTTYLKPGETNEQMRVRVNATMPNGQAGDAGVVDGLEALRQIRAHAAEFGIDPHRVGVVGFSAGGHVAGMMASAANEKDRPDFAGLIYGMPFKTPIPPIPAANLPYPPGTPKEPWLQPKPTPAPGALPPMFMVLAQDDLVAGYGFRPYYDALFAAGYRPELHLYHAGNHGFGMKPQGTTSDHWIDEFGWWIEAMGFNHAAKPAAGK
ncbi:MAG TPA: alpha/beta hydrolase [Novosphingobium sp.]|nr:alpha/beta hydrolase [Novosphingobium sp.]